MNILILSIGKFAKSCSNRELFEEYQKKTKLKIKLIEIPSNFNGSTDEIKKKEGDLISNKVPKNAKIILLDETGENLTSRKFARKIENFQNQSTQNLVFIIGGANGVSAKIKEKSDLKISFGQMTFPHMMIRCMLAEQLYRAYLIINNHPYHKD